MAKDNSGRESEYKRIDKMRQGTQDAADGALAELRQNDYGKYKDVKSVLNNGEPWVETEPMNIEAHNASMQARADKAMADWAKSNPDLYASFVNSQRRPYENGRFGFEGSSGVNLNSHGADYIWPENKITWPNMPDALVGGGTTIIDRDVWSFDPYRHQLGNQVYNYDYYTNKGLRRMPSSVPEGLAGYEAYPTDAKFMYDMPEWQKPKRVETPSYLNTDLNSTGPVQAPSRQMPPETASAARTGGENIYRGVQNQPKRTKGPVFNGAAGAGAAMKAINLARDNPTAMTVGIAATLSAVLANNLMNSGMEAAAAYDGAKQMLSDAKDKYDELKQSGFADDVASYFSGWGELLDDIAANASTEGMTED